MRDGIAYARDGTALRYTLYGEQAPGRRVVLVHSLGLDQTIWKPVAERLSTTAQVLLYDCRGHGASGRAQGPYSLDQFADDLASLLDAVGWRTAVVGGASMGGNVAQAFVVQYSDRIEGLALVDTTAWYGPDSAQHWAERGRQAQERGLSSLIDFQLTRWFSDVFRQQHPDVVEQFAQVFLQNDVSFYVAACNMLGTLDLRERVRRIRVPTAVIVGEEDYATPVAMARKLHEAIPGSSLDILPATRHLSPLERPDEVASILRRLLEAAPSRVEAEIPAR
jgi:3-oxoadipate enol-lactonase